MDNDVLGPIDYLAVEFPDGRVTGEGFRLIMDLVRRGIIRVLDLEFLARSADGIVRKVGLSEVGHTEDLDVAIWQAAESDVLDQSDLDVIAASMSPGSVAGVLVYENVWAAPLISAIDRNHARILGEGRIAAEDLLAALDATKRA